MHVLDLKKILRNIGMVCGCSEDTLIDELSCPAQYRMKFRVGL